MVFEPLLNFWKAVKVTYISGDINKAMYYYLTGVIIVVYGLLMYLFWQGFVGVTIIANQWFLNRISEVPFTITNAIGIILLIRYSIFGAVETLKKKAPENLEQRLKAIEDKMHVIYKMATDIDYEPPKE